MAPLALVFAKVLLFQKVKAWSREFPVVARSLLCKGMKRQGATVNIAVTVWGQRVSPVFDAARTLLVAEIDHGTLTTTALLAFDPAHPGELVRLLRARGVQVIICGAVSAEPAALLEAAGFDLVPFVTGPVPRVLEAFARGQAFDRELCMPGCGAALCCGGRIRRGREIGGAGERGQGRRRIRQELPEVAVDTGATGSCRTDAPAPTNGSPTGGTDRPDQR